MWHVRMCVGLSICLSVSLCVFYIASVKVHGVLHPACTYWCGGMDVVIRQVHSVLTRILK